jgi:hypothetical protein
MSFSRIENPDKTEIDNWDREDFMTYFGSDKGLDLYQEAFTLYYDDMVSKGEKFKFIFSSFFRHECCAKYLSMAKRKHRKKQIENLLDETT